jgi:CheY-like chemotaxis protein
MSETDGDALQPQGVSPHGVADPEGEDGAAVRARYLFVVARTRLDVFLKVRRRYLDDGSVRVMLDRRQQERRSQTRPPAVERRRQPDRRQPRDYWEDIAHHPAVIIPLASRPPEPADAEADRSTAIAPHEEPVMQPALADEARILAWLEETRHIVQSVFPALLDERDALGSRLQDAARRCRSLEEENEALRAEVARLGAAHRQLGQEHARMADGLDQLLGRLELSLQPMRELARAHREALASATLARGARTGGGRVLLVDDDQTEVAALRQALGRLGYAVKVAVSAREALGLVAVFDPDAVLLTLPERSGADVLDHLRGDHPEVPVIVVTGRDDVQAALARGAVACLARPLDAEGLERALASVVQPRRRVADG